ncbi:MAG: pitrilysin family protein [Sediminibacterium sp.]|nr:pitrilysin family protein [Sediminibacterium sp.]
MINFDKFTLDNGLTVIVEEDRNTPLVSFNTLYKVGAKHENPNKTGLAHLFEHLMFCGSLHVNDYDRELNLCGGENNAFTTNDFTNYYATLPVENLETIFWLESDRMLSLNFDERSLNIQKKVVIEEYKEQYLNKPYGNVWHLMRNLAFSVHPYNWMTIGKDMNQINDCSLTDIKEFFYKYYRPNNAIISIVGNVQTAKVKYLFDKWYSQIPASIIQQSIPSEPEQTQLRRLETIENVKHNYLMMAWKTVERLSNQYPILDLVSYLLGHGESSRLYQVLIKERKLFSTIQCYHLGSIDPSLIIICGHLRPKVTMEQGEQAIRDILNELCQQTPKQDEITKIINKIQTIHAFENTEILNRAQNLAFYEMLGDASLLNIEFDQYLHINPTEVLEFSKQTFQDKNLNILNYYAQQ